MKHPTPDSPVSTIFSLTVTDLQASVDWYQRVFGIRCLDVRIPHRGGEETGYCVLLPEQVSAALRERAGGSRDVTLWPYSGDMAWRGMHLRRDASRCGYQRGDQHRQEDHGAETDRNQQQDNRPYSCRRSRHAGVVDAFHGWSSGSGPGHHRRRPLATKTPQNASL